MDFSFKDVRLFAWQELYYAELENDTGIEAFKLLNVNQEQSLLVTKTKFIEGLKKDEEYNNLEDSEKRNYYYYFYEREEKTIKELQRQQRYSMCLSVFSFFEGRLRDICTKIEDEFNFKIKLDDLNRSDDLKRYWNYLAKVYEMKMDTLEPIYMPIKQNKAIRNIIAHQHGNANKEQSAKLNLGHGISLKEFDPYFQIQIEKDVFINYLLDKMDLFFKAMVLAIDDRYREKKAAHK